MCRTEKGIQVNLGDAPRVCGVHEGATTLANKIFQQGYYWPTAKKKARELVNRCDICQRFAKAINSLTTPQLNISSSRPFSQWRIDILGSFPKTVEQKRFVIVAIVGPSLNGPKQRSYPPSQSGK
ncbi:uncharacterized protein LOC110601986 [Manihot esculenta]|uniref:uncharacterized protein LOC110601986 n=1 Tax=Manihot esculenta TaxID=3983 RepID=UPI000B5D8967|nr:uncharacterized protein LOC110601986 [Manihot esculenta]